MKLIGYSFFYVIIFVTIKNILYIPQVLFLGDVIMVMKVAIEGVLVIVVYLDNLVGLYTHLIAAFLHAPNFVGFSWFIPQR